MDFQRMANNLTVLLATILLGLSTAGTAMADLVYDSNLQVTGTGLGAVNTLVTVHDPGGPGNQNGTESGCINQNGTFSPCLFGVEGGDNTAINQVLTFDTSYNFAAVVNISETGQDVTVTLTDLYLTFCSTTAASCYSAQYLGPDLDLTQGTGTGLGGSGFAFKLTALEYASVLALPGDFVTLSGGVQFANGSTNDGNDTLHVIQFVGERQVPEPSTLLLLGVGLTVVFVLARWRLHRP